MHNTVGHTASNDEFSLLELASRACDGTLLPEEQTRLEEILQSSEDARNNFGCYMLMHGELQWQFRNELEDNAESQDAYTESATTYPAGGFLASVAQFPNIFGHVSSLEWPVAYLVATVVLAIGLTIAAFTYVSSSKDIAQQFPSAVGDLPSTPSVVGHITATADCKWSIDGDPTNSKSELPNPKSPIHLGDRFHISSGLLEIAYDSGAKVILQGPVTYEVDSETGGYLAVGKLTARLEKKDERGTTNEERAASHSSLLVPDCSFAVRTPTAIVTDLGTEFGVEVSTEGHTTSHVFRGSVRLQAVSNAGRAEGVAQTLHENESARVERRASGQGNGNQIERLGSSFPITSFVRKIPGQSIKTLDLVDVVAGGDGSGKARGCGIDPTTGNVSATQSVETDLSSDGRYHNVKERPFIDGVFIPNSGKSPVQLDSASHFFSGFSNITGKSWGNIWAGGEFPNGRFGNISCRLLRGFDYSSPWHSMLGIHANKGITFDLETIRRANPQWDLTKFLSVAGNPISESFPNKCDIWVFVDGQTRFCRQGITFEDGELKIVVPLNNQARFLTFVATDGGDGSVMDAVIFGDPRLILAKRSDQ